MDEQSKMKDNNSAFYVPASILLAALVITGALFMVGGDISAKISGLTITAGTGDNGGSGSGNTGTTGNTQQPSADGVRKIDLASYIDDDPVMGSEDADVTLIEFSDFQCPFCERFTTGAVETIRSDYVDTGKMKLEFRDFPLSFHPMAQKSAEAAACAADQGKFWEYHDKLFANQASLSVDNLKKWASELKLNTSTFNSCLDNNDKAAEVQKDLAAGTALGVSGTPTSLILFDNMGDKQDAVKAAVQALRDASSSPDYFEFILDSKDSERFGVMIVGAQPVQAFKAVFDAAGI